MIVAREETNDKIVSDNNAFIFSLLLTTFGVC